MNAGAKRCFYLFINLMIFCFAVSSSFAGEVCIFGPKKYIRTRGAPDLYTEIITVPFPDYVNTGKMVVLNGNQVDERRVENSIGSAEIFLNGEPIFVPSDFNQKVYYLEAPINLAGNDYLWIEIRSSPGSYLTIQIIQDLAPQTVSISADPDAIKVNENSTLRWSSILADACSIEPGIGSVGPSGMLSVSAGEVFQIGLG